MQLLFVTIVAGALVWLLCAPTVNRVTRKVLSTPANLDDSEAANRTLDGESGAAQQRDTAAAPGRRATEAQAEHHTERDGPTPRAARPAHPAPLRPAPFAATRPPRSARVLSELSGTLMSSSPVAGDAVSVVVLAVGGRGAFEEVHPGDLVSVLCDAHTYGRARMLGVEPFGEVTVRMSSVPVPGEVFFERRVEILPVATPPR